ncbi:MAG: hypothetical protein QOE62_1192 [Actinomycetota bacterium]|nr:hypothetical protein [Actinomycetota bacterium]
MTGDLQLEQLARPFGARLLGARRAPRRVERPVLVLLTAIALCALPAVFLPARAAAAVNPWPHTVTGGFATSDGRGLYVLFGDGSVSAIGNARNMGDGSGVSLNRPMASGAITSGGYWLVSKDGGIFSYGAARFYGSTGGRRLNQPVFAMAPTNGGKGYWLAARDGGIFSFGDAHFYGSTGNINLVRPIVGITSSHDGRGYRLVASDGGIFDFGSAGFYGSLPSRGISVNDVVGMAPTPTGKGYWIAEANGVVHSFGDAANFGNFSPNAFDPVTAIATNPAAPGYRLITSLGATIPFGRAPAGAARTDPQYRYLSQLVCRPVLNSAGDYQAMLNTSGPLWNRADGASSVELGDGRRLWLFGDTYTGLSNANGIMPGWRLVRNTIAVEQKGCFEFRTGGAFATDDYLPSPGPGQFYWPNVGIVDAAAGVIRLSVTRVRNVPGPAGFGFQTMWNEIVTLDLHSLTFRGSTALRTDPGHVQWGMSMMQAGGWIYLYGGAGNGYYYGARTTPAHLLDGTWQYGTGTANGWSTRRADLRPMQFRTFTNQPDPGMSAAISVDRYGSGYIVSSKRCEGWCDDVTAWYSKSPAGPWKAVNSNNGRIATTPAAPGQITYNGHLVHVNGGWIAVWALNTVSGSYVKDGFGARDAVPQNLPSPAALAAAP